MTVQIVNETSFQLPNKVEDSNRITQPSTGPSQNRKDLFIIFPHLCTTAKSIGLFYKHLTDINCIQTPSLADIGNILNMFSNINTTYRCLAQLLTRTISSVLLKLK